MKNIIYIGLSILLIKNTVYAQVPEMLSYQIVIRDNSGQLISNQTVGVLINILQGNINGISVYAETHTTNTNYNGLISIQVGNGTLVNGNFSNINWADGNFFIKTETDPDGGSNYSNPQTHQLMTVPFAFKAKTATTLSGSFNEIDPHFETSLAADLTTSDTLSWNTKQNQLTASNGLQIVGDTISRSKNRFYLGQDTLGGIVYYIYTGHDGQQHGLIISKLSTQGRWQSTNSLINAYRTWDGAYNTNLMTDSPIADWVHANFTLEWYIPSIDELSYVWHNRSYINRTFEQLGMFGLSNNTGYWSSTSNNINVAWFFDFGSGKPVGGGSAAKTNSKRVHAVRTF